MSSPTQPTDTRISKRARESETRASPAVLRSPNKSEGTSGTEAASLPGRRGKRRKSSNRGFPTSFPRLDGATVSSLASPTGAPAGEKPPKKPSVVKEPWLLQEFHRNQFRLSVRDVAVDGIRASVSAGRLEDLFFGADTMESSVTGRDSDRRLSHPEVDRRGRDSDDPGELTMRREFGLFEELSPTRRTGRVDVADACLEGKEEAHTGEDDEEDVERDVGRKTDGNGGKSLKFSSAEEGGVEGRCEDGGGPQVVEDILGCERIGVESTALDAATDHGETTGATALRSQTAGTADEAGSAWAMDPCSRSMSSEEGGSGNSYSSVPETPSPKVSAPGTPPSSPSEDQQQQWSSPHRSDPGGQDEDGIDELVASADSALPHGRRSPTLVHTATEPMVLAIPETQMPTEGFDPMCSQISEDKRKVCQEPKCSLAESARDTDRSEEPWAVRPVSEIEEIGQRAKLTTNRVRGQQTTAIGTPGSPARSPTMENMAVEEMLPVAGFTPTRFGSGDSRPREAVGDVKSTTDGLREAGSSLESIEPDRRVELQEQISEPPVEPGAVATTKREDSSSSCATRKARTPARHTQGPADADTGRSLVESGSEVDSETITPARPRQLAGKFESCCVDAKKKAEDSRRIREQAAEFEEPETPSSLGADFEYFPAGQSQEAVPGDTDENGITAAEMLRLQRNLAQESPTLGVSQAVTPIPAVVNGRQETRGQQPAVLVTTKPTGRYSVGKSLGVGSGTTLPTDVSEEFKASEASCKFGLPVIDSPSTSPSSTAATAGTLHTDARHSGVNTIAGVHNPYSSEGGTSLSTRGRDPTTSHATHSQETFQETRPSLKSPLRANRHLPSPPACPPPKNPGELLTDVHGLEQKPGATTISKSADPPSPHHPRQAPEDLRTSRTLMRESPALMPGSDEPVGLAAGDGGEVVKSDHTFAFRTARGRALRVSAEALAKVEHLFKDGDSASSAAQRRGKESTLSSSSASSIPKSSGALTRSLKEASGLGGSNNVGGTYGVERIGGRGGIAYSRSAEVGMTVGGPAFQTGKGKAISVSEEALKRIEHMFRDGDPPKETEAAPFRSRRGRLSSPGTVRGVIKSVEKPGGAGDGNGGAFRGKHEIRVASERRASQSEESNRSADNRCLRTSTENYCGPIVEATVSGTTSAASSRSSSFPKPPNTLGTMFQTGKGRGLVVSAEAMARVSHMFTDDERDGDDQGSKKGAGVPRGVVGSSLNSKATGVATKPMKCSEGDRRHVPLENSNLNSAVKAKVATTRTQGQILGEQRNTTNAGGGNRDSLGNIGSAEPEDTNDHHGSGEKRCGGASGNTSMVPAELVSAGSLFETAGGRPLTVSAEAISKVEHMFREEHPPGASRTAFVPPKADGSSVSEARMASSSALHASSADYAETLPEKDAVESTEEVKQGVPKLANRTTGVNMGAADDSTARTSTEFSTARGRTLTVSATALAKVSHMFDENSATKGDGDDSRTGGAKPDRMETLTAFPGKKRVQPPRGFVRRAPRVGYTGGNTGMARSPLHSPGMKRRATGNATSAMAVAGTTGGASSCMTSPNEGGMNVRKLSSGGGMPMTSGTLPLSVAAHAAVGPTPASSKSGDGTSALSTGFKTGTGKPVDVSADALEKTSHLFAANQENEKKELGLSTEDAVRQRKVATPAFHALAAIPTPGPASTIVSHQGSPRFRTGSNSSVTPAAILAGNNVGGVNGERASLEVGPRGGDCSMPNNLPRRKTLMTSGFHTGRGAPVRVSAEALERARKMLGEASEEVDAVVSSRGQQGPEGIDEEAGMEKGPGVPSDSAGPGSTRRDDHNRFDPCKREKTSEGALQYRGHGNIDTRKRDSDQSSAHDYSALMSKDTKGETSVRHEKLPSGEESSSSVSFCVGESGVDHGKLAMVLEGTGDRTRSLPHSGSRVRSNVHDGDREGKRQEDAGEMLSSGFSTGKGRPVHVSPGALARVRSMFEDEPVREPSSPVASVPRLASSASHRAEVGKNDDSVSLRLSKTSSPLIPAVVADKRHLEGIGEVVGNETTSTRTTGGALAVVPSVFSTGKGRVLEVSEEALERVKRMFAGTEDGMVSENAPPPSRESCEAYAGAAASGGMDGACVAVKSALGPITQHSGIRTEDSRSSDKNSTFSCIPRIAQPEGKENGEVQLEGRGRGRGCVGDVSGTPSRSPCANSAKSAATPTSGRRGIVPARPTPGSAHRMLPSGTRSLGSSPTPRPGRKMVPPMSGRTCATPSPLKAMLRSGEKTVPVSLSGVPPTSPVKQDTCWSSSRRAIGGVSVSFPSKRPRSEVLGAGSPATPSPRVLGPGSGGIKRGLHPRASPALRGSTSVAVGGVSSSSVVTGRAGMDPLCDTGEVRRTPISKSTASWTVGDRSTASVASVPGTLCDGREDGEALVDCERRRAPLASLLRSASLVGKIAAATATAEATLSCGMATKSLVGADKDTMSPMLPGSSSALPSSFNSRTTVVGLLDEITADNARNVRFGCDGMPCCIGGERSLRSELGARGSTAECDGRSEGKGCTGPGSPESRGQTIVMAVDDQRPRNKNCCQVDSLPEEIFRGELIRDVGEGELATVTWVANHFRWIVWKLAATERRFPDLFPNGYLTAERVSRQLRYRYDVEITRARKPALKAVLQGDAASSRPMILCVSHIYSDSELLSRRGAASAVVEVTDGWYPVDASLDESLAHFLRRGEIKPGVKLAISNASLEAGSAELSGALHGAAAAADGDGRSRGLPGVDPLELLKKRDAGDLLAGTWPRLRLGVNYTRRARWDAKLGFVIPLRRGKVPGAIRQEKGCAAFPDKGRRHPDATDGTDVEMPSFLEVPLCTVVAGGGLVAATTVVVLRRYPAQYLTGDFAATGEEGAGRQRLLTEAEEEGERELHQARCQRMAEQAAADVQEEVMADLEDATPASFRQMREVMEGLRQKAMNDRLRDTSGFERRSRRLITLRVSCTCVHSSSKSACAGGAGGPSMISEHAPPPGGKLAKRDSAHEGSGRGARRAKLPPMAALLKIWAPDETTAACLTEGSELRLYRVAASHCRYHVAGCSIELSTGRHTKIEVISARPPPQAVAAADGTSCSTNPSASCVRRYTPRWYTTLSELVAPDTLTKPRDRTCSWDVGSQQEADFVGCVFAITREDPSATGGEVITCAQAEPTGSVAKPPPHGDGGGSPKLKRTAQADKPASDGVDHSGAPASETTYRVYLVDQTGTCVCLERTLPEDLAVHHRILRSTAGSCWMFVNAMRPSKSSVGRYGAARSVRFLTPLCESEDERTFGLESAVAKVGWFSLTAIGGAGGAPPPSTLGGAPSSHLHRPLLDLRSWAEGRLGRGMLRRQFQRLALVLKMRKTRRTVWSSNEREKGPSGLSEGSEQGMVGQKSGVDISCSLMSQGMTQTLVGFVSSFELSPPSVLVKPEHGGIPFAADVERKAPNDKAHEQQPLRVGIDTGGQLVRLRISRPLLEKLLRETLDLDPGVRTACVSELSDEKEARRCASSLGGKEAGTQVKSDALPREFKGDEIIAHQVREVLQWSKPSLQGRVSDGCGEQSRHGKDWLARARGTTKTLAAEDYGGETWESGKTSSTSRREGAVESLVESIFRVALYRSSTARVLPIEIVSCARAPGVPDVVAPRTSDETGNRLSNEEYVTEAGDETRHELSIKPPAAVSEGPRISGGPLASPGVSGRDVTMDGYALPREVVRGDWRGAGDDSSAIHNAPSRGEIPYGAVASSVARADPVARALKLLGAGCGRRQMAFTVGYGPWGSLGQDELGDIRSLEPVDPIRSTEGLLDELS